MTSPGFLDALADALADAPRQRHECTCRTRSGDVIPVQIVIASLNVADRPALLLMIHDLREHRLAQLGLAVAVAVVTLRARWRHPGEGYG